MDWKIRESGRHPSVCRCLARPWAALAGLHRSGARFTLGNPIAAPEDVLALTDQRRQSDSPRPRIRAIQSNPIAENRNRRGDCTASSRQCRHRIAVNDNHDSEATLRVENWWQKGWHDPLTDRRWTDQRLRVVFVCYLCYLGGASQCSACPGNQEYCMYWGGGRA